jgi:hypothetical protein
VADIHAHQLAVEVDEALTFRCPEVNALCVIDWNWINSSLCGPFEQGVSATKLDDL